jgi:hypothetical protein
MVASILFNTAASPIVSDTKRIFKIAVRRSTSAGRNMECLVKSSGEEFQAWPNAYIQHARDIRFFPDYTLLVYLKILRRSNCTESEPLGTP